MLTFLTSLLTMLLQPADCSFAQAEYKLKLVEITDCTGLSDSVISKSDTEPLTVLCNSACPLAM